MNQFLENNLENGLIPVLKRYGIPKTQQCVTLGTNNLTRRINFFINAEMNFPSCRATESVMTTGRSVNWTYCKIMINFFLRRTTRILCKV